MIRTKLFTASALACAVSIIGASAGAQEPANQITYFTFSAPFELPGGQVLPAGKYVFRIADSPSNRHIVHVLSEDRTKMHATLFAIPVERQIPANEPEVRFMEAEANAAPAIRTWWYPGRSVGHEFIYPKNHARRLASQQREGVLTVAGDARSDDEMRSAELARLGADGREEALSADRAVNEHGDAAVAGQTGNETGQPAAHAGQMTAQSESSRRRQSPTATASVGRAQSESTSADAQRTASTATAERTSAPANERLNDRTAPEGRTELPRTAGMLPLVALLGLSSLLGAGIVRLWR